MNGGSPPGPTHDLEQIKYFCRLEPFCRISERARFDAYALDMDEDDIVECICALTLAMFVKTMKSETFKERMQDVYITSYSNRTMYVKLDLDPDCAHVISFHEEGNPE